MKNIFRLILLVTLAGLLNPPSASALFGFKKREKPPAAGRVIVSENKEARVLFFPTGASDARKDLDGKKRKWAELSYKLVNLSEDSPALFGSPEGWVAVEFLDREDFVLAADPVPYSELKMNREYYGFVWVPKEKVREMVKARARQLRDDEIPAARNKRAAAARAVIAEPSPSPEPAALSTPEPSPSPTPESSPSPTPEPAPSPEPDREVTMTTVPGTDPTPLPTPTPEPSPSPSAEATVPPPFERGGATNDEVTAVLETQEKQPSTTIEESPSTLAAPQQES